ncbi:MAG TPA: S-layer homology domain-containing protein, partial [Tissierellia bacterium]|nr:S-layer homology domain-containing protein [Tissierellia bacterium]
MKKIMRYITLLIIIALLSTHYDAFAADETPAIVFSDLDETHWAYEGIYKLVYEGIIVGYPDGTFRPNAEITRAEFVTLICRMLGLEPINSPSKFKDVD